VPLTGFRVLGVVVDVSGVNDQLKFSAKAGAEEEALQQARRRLGFHVNVTLSAVELGLNNDDLILRPGIYQDDVLDMPDIFEQYLSSFGLCRLMTEFNILSGERTSIIIRSSYLPMAKES